MNRLMTPQEFLLRLKIVRQYLDAQLDDDFQRFKRKLLLAAGSGEDK